MTDTPALRRMLVRRGQLVDLDAPIPGAASPEQVTSYRNGRTATLGWFVGQVMKRSGGKANPGVVNALLKEALDP